MHFASHEICHLFSAIKNFAWENQWHWVNDEKWMWKCVTSSQSVWNRAMVASRENEWGENGNWNSDDLKLCDVMTGRGETIGGLMQTIYKVLRWIDRPCSLHFTLRALSSFTLSLHLHLPFPHTLSHQLHCTISRTSFEWPRGKRAKKTTK